MINEDRYRTLLEDIADGYYEVDIVGNFTFFNEAVCQILGYPRDELMGMNYQAYTDKKNTQIVYQKFNDVYNTGEPARAIEWEILRKDGAKRQVEVSISLIRDSKDQPTGFRGIVRDVTELQQAKEALRKAHEELEQQIEIRTAELAQANAKLEREINERVQTAEALTEERNLLRTLIDNLPDFIFVKDAESRFVINNRAHVRVLGASSQEEVLGKTDLDIFPRDLAAQYYADEQAIIQSGQALVNREEPYVEPGGDTRWLSTTKVPLRDNQGKILGLVGISRDITERKQAEESLAASEAKYRELVQNANSIIFRMDTQGRVIFFNEFAQRFFGYTEEEILGQSIVGTFVPERETTGRDLAAMIEDMVQHPEQYANNENENMRRDGERVWVAWTNKAILDDEGHIREILCIGNDITRQKRVESLLAERVKEIKGSERLLRSIIDATPDWIFVKDQEHRFRLVNQSFATMFHRTTEECIGKNDLDLGMPEKLVKGDPEQNIRGSWADDRQVMDTGESLIIPHDLVMTDGELRVLNTVKSPLRDAEGKVWGMLGVGRDVTERERLLADLEQRTSQLETAAEVARAASSILNPDELIQQVVNLVRERFDLYYAGLFLVDQSGEWTGKPGKWVVLRAGTGEAGQQMLEAGHKLEIGGTSMIGWCVANAQARVALDVGEEAVRFDNPWLPETRSEMALPLISRGQVMGAMTIQSTREAAFSDQDIATLQAMADQLAVAIENARLFDQAQAALQEAQAAHQQYLRREWESFLATRKDQEEVGYVLTRDGLKPGCQVWTPEIQLAMQNCQPVVVTDTDGALFPTQHGDGGGVFSEPAIKARSALAAPITLRGQVIGALDVFDPDQPHEWTDDDLALVEAVTSQVALAVENARLFEQTQAALAETEALYRASRRITSGTNLPALYQILVDEMASRLGAGQCRLLIFDQKKGYGEIVAEYLPTPNEAKTPIPMAQDPLYAILRNTQRPLPIEDVSKYPDIAQLRDALDQRNVKSTLLVPIVVRGELLGGLQIDSLGQERIFTEAELDFCQTLASQAAITIDNMRAFEEQKETAQRLREIDRFKTQFLANMSHELRTPLNSIIGFSRVILKGIDGPLTELQQTDLTAIYNSGQHLLGLINDILDLSKIEAGKMELNFDELDLRPILKGVMSTAVGLVKDRPIELEQHVPEDLPIIWADNTRVRQVLLNLISNATKFTERGKITLSAYYDDEWVTVSVADTGVGIPPEKLESIFEEFTQVDGSTTRRFGGTGLGLPISRHFVEMHGGKIAVESKEGLGSTFTVRLPIRAQTESKTEPVENEQEGQAQAMERRLVLAVDDDPGVISLYRRYLEREGYQVIGVADSSEVINKAIELRPFAITLDVLMPNKDGWQILRELKECAQTQNIPIIICSIVSDKGQAFSLGAADYLVKPIMEEELLAALARLDQKEEEAKVLVIDDQADDILLIRRILEAQPGYGVIEGHGGQIGIDLVYQHKPDLIILDLMMPEMDGFAVLEALKRDTDTRNIPVIVITAKVLTKEERQRLNGQVEVLLHKGLFTEQELLEDLARALSQIESRQAERP